MDSGSKMVVALAVCVLAAGGAAVAFAIISDSGDSYSITYVLDGGTLQDGAPTEYTAKDRPDLPSAYKDGYVLLGWRLSEDSDEVIKIFPRNAKGDITLYATWEISQVGKRIVFDHYEDYDTLGLTGTPVDMTFDYVGYSYPDGYLMCRTQGTDRDPYWTSDNDGLRWTVAKDNQTISTVYFGQKECEVWTGVSIGHKEVQYVSVDDGEVYRMESYSKNALGLFVQTDFFELKSITTVELLNYFDLGVYPDIGITVTEVPDLYPTQTYTVTASVTDGYSFGGWYDDSGNLLGSEPVLTGIVEKDMRIRAANTIEYEHTDTITSGSKNVLVHPAGTLTELSWTAISRTSEVTGGTFSGTGSSVTVGNVGVYDIFYSGKDTSGTVIRGAYTELVDGYYSFTWKYKGTSYTLDTEISAQSYLNWKNSTITRSSTTSEKHILEFVTYNDPVVTAIAAKFNTMCTGMTDAQRANVMLSYTQAIPYQYDSDFCGIDEYWKYPVETVFDGAGDCEDTSILFCAIAKAMGFDAAISTLYVSDASAGFLTSFVYGANHCMGLINVPGIVPEADAIVKIGDTTYYLCETTASGYGIGVNPWESFSVKTKLKIV